MKPRFLTISIMIIAAALTRLVPHPWNFTPIAAMALFAGASFDDLRVALVVPLIALIIGDIVLGFHSTIPFVYGAFILTVLLGWAIRNKKKVGTIALASIFGSTLFFFVTNLGVWLVSGIYPETLAGLGQCFILALPFFKLTLLGDLFFAAFLFGSFYGLERALPALKTTTTTIA